MKNKGQNNRYAIPDVGKLWVNKEMSINKGMTGKEKSPKLGAFHGSGDLTRTDDTPGMNRML